jgi:hypothetical protein
MLDAFIIEDMNRRQREKENKERPRVYIEIPYIRQPIPETETPNSEVDFEIDERRIAYSSIVYLP